MKEKTKYQWLGQAFTASLLMLVLIFSSSKLFAHPQFNTSLLNIREGNDNTRLLLSLEPSLFHINEQSGELRTDLLLRVSFRSMPRGQVLLLRQIIIQARPDFLSGLDPFFYQFNFEVPAGSYSVILEIEDKIGHRTYLEDIAFVSRNMQAPIAISDPILVQEFGGAMAARPLLGEHITSGPDHLSMSLNVFAAKGSFFTARTVLYRKQSNSFTGPTDTERIQSNQYLTMSQSNAVVDARNGVGEIRQSLDLNELPHGEYLVEIYLYRDDALVAEASRSFTIDWKFLKDVFGDLPQAIEMMEWVASQEKISSLLKIKNADEQLQEFMDFWNARANPGRENAMDAIERYFSRIFYANANFREDLAGWKTDRGKTLVLFGQPEHQSSVKFNGRLFEAWSYTRWGMRFLFRNDDGIMRKIAIG